MKNKNFKRSRKKYFYQNKYIDFIKKNKVAKLINNKYLSQINLYWEKQIFHYKLLNLYYLIIINTILSTLWLYLIISYKFNKFIILFNFFNFFSCSLILIWKFVKIQNLKVNNYGLYFYYMRKKYLVLFSFFIFPLGWFENYYIKIYDYILGKYLILSLNDLIFFINIIKLFYLNLFYFIKIYFYKKNFSKLYLLFGVLKDEKFRFKFLYYDNKIKLPLFLWFYFMIIHSLILNIVSNRNNGLINSGFFKSFWVNYIALSQIGYGDFHPNSLFSKLIIISNISFGFVFIFLIILGIKKKINKKSDQIQMVYKTIKILKYKNEFYNKLVNIFIKLLINKKFKNINTNNNFLNIKKNLNLFLNKLLTLNLSNKQNHIIFIYYVNKNISDKLNKLIKILKK